MSGKTVHTILARNSLTNLARYLVNFAVIFYLTPTIIHAVGDAQYGLWALTFSLVGYAGLLDMGVQLTTIKLVAQFNAQHDLHRLSRLCSTVFCFFLAIGLLAAVSCWFVLPAFMPSFISDPASLKISGQFLWIIGIDVIFVFLGNVFVGIGLGLQQYHLRGFLDMAMAVVKLAATVWVLHLGMGLPGLAWVKLTLDAITALTMFWICLRTVPGLRIHPGLLNCTSINEVCSFGGKLFLSSTMIRINQNTIPVIISAYLSTAWLAYYTVASRLSGYYKDLVYSITASFLPMFSEIMATGSIEKVRELYLNYTRLILFITLPGYVFLLVSGPALLEAWIGPHYAQEGADVMRLLALAALFEGLQPLAGRVIVGGGQLSGYVKWTASLNILAMIACLILVPLLGVKGAGLSIAVTDFVSLLAVTAIVRNLYGIPVLRYVRVLAGVLPPMLAFWAALKLGGADETGLGLGGLLARGLAAYGAALVVIGFCLTTKERGTLVSQFISRPSVPITGSTAAISVSGDNDR